MRTRHVLWAAVLLLPLLQLVSSQQGQVLGGLTFHSLDCGTGSALAYYVDPSIPRLIWESDRYFISTGSLGTVSAAIPRVPRQLQSLRFFPAGSSPTKNCYVLPLDNGKPHLIRAGFLYGNYDQMQSTNISFQMALESTVLADVIISDSSSPVVYYEMILHATPAASVSLCLLRSGSAAPFINSLEIRELNNGMYYYNFGFPTYFLLLNRVNFGASGTIRYPDDLFDRVWPPDGVVFPTLGGIRSSSPAAQLIDTASNISDVFPQAVMSTALSDQIISYTRPIPAMQTFYTFTYYAELNASRSPTDRRIMQRTDNFGSVDMLVIEKPYVAYGYGYFALRSRSFTSYTVTLRRDASSTLDAIASADELYLVKASVNGTDHADAEALASLRTAYNLIQWVGDPCKPVPWDELTCTDPADISTLSRVTSLDLSGKNLRGNILSSSITLLSSLRTLILSNNSFSGEIPSDLQTLPALNVLNVANNELIGGLDSWLLSLSSLDVSNNQLNGTFPSSLLSLQTFRFAGNPLLQCSQVGEIVCNSPPPPPGSPPPPPGASSSSILPIVLGILGGLLVLGIVVGISVWCLCYRKPKLPTISSGEAASSADNRFVGTDAAVSLSLEAVKAATRNYAKKIGEGGFGPVYHGQLRTRTKNLEVAVKILSGKSAQGSVEFFNEISLLSTLHHRNLVGLVGYCHEPPDLILLYKFLPGGDLRERLYGSHRSPPLSWLQRLSIAWDAAKGLEYLHNGCRHGIIHRDVKTSNILLTTKMDAKLADFGLSKLRSEGDSKDGLATKVQGTVGYLDPEYSTTGYLTESSDVYSFGVVLMEILTGTPLFATHGSGPPGDRYIVVRVEKAVKACDVTRVVDPAVGTSYSVESAWILAETAIGCTRPTSSARPDIAGVVGGLTRALEKEQFRSTSVVPSTVDSDQRTDITYLQPEQPKPW